MARRKTKNEDLNRLSTEEFKQVTKNPITVVLDNVRSLHNVGSAFRTCDAFLVKKLYLTGITGRPPHRDINKTALGATDSVAWEYYENVVDLIKELKRQGYLTIAIEQVENAQMLHHFEMDVNRKYVFVFGNEVFGVNEEVIQEVDACIEILQSGTKHSLNISVSIGITLWEFVRKIIR